MAVGTKVEIQGESEYKKALKEITSSLKLVSSEMKLTSSEFERGDKSLRQTKASYQDMNKSVQEQKEKINSLRTALEDAEKTYGKNNSTVQDLKTKLNQAELQMREMEDATDKSTKELKEMKNGFDDAGKGATTFGDVLKANLTSEAIIGGIKALGSAVKTIGSAFVDIGKQALDSYADFEQLQGGVKKLFGEDMSAVMTNANNAFKTAGMNVNEYMETVTGFSASLISSLNGNTQEAVRLSDVAIRDMSDNANTFGTDLASLQNAYQGFAKGQFNMLDNLKLGFSGSKEGMQSLLDKAEEISGKQFDISSFADITEAIHIMQVEMGIAETTVNEASGTISGSIGMMKSAWENLLTGMANTEVELELLVDDLVESIGFVGENVLKVVPTIIDAIGSIVLSLADVLLANMPMMLDTGMKLLQKIIDGIVTMIPQLMPVVIQIINTLTQFIVKNLPTILQAGITILVELVKGISQSLPELIPAIVDAVLLIVETLIDNIDLIVDAGIQLILGLADGLIEALPRLIEKAPIIIQKLVDAIIRNFPKIISAGGQLIGELVMGISGAVWKLFEVAPQLISTLVSGIANGWHELTNIGKYLVEGMWNGIVNKASWLYDKVTSFASNIVSNIKNALGIHSPSRVFRDEVGKNMALGLGEGFSNTMSNVTKEMESAIPTQFDTNVNMKSSTGASGSNYDMMISAFEKALTNVKVVMNDREFGTFVSDTMEGLVYS